MSGLDPFVLDVAHAVPAGDENHRESTLRDAYHREFFAVMVPDATLQAGADFIFEATVFNVQRFFGWTAPSEAVIQALKGSAQLSAA